MTPVKKDSPPVQEKSTATPAPEVHADDWRAQSEPHPVPSGPSPAAPVPQHKSSPPVAAVPFASGAPPAPYALTRTITIQCYTAAGHPMIPRITDSASPKDLQHSGATNCARDIYNMLQ